MAMKRAFPVALLGLTLVALAGCGESPVASGTEPVQRPSVASPVSEAELAELPPPVTPLADAARADTTRTPVTPVEPTFPGLAETPGGPAPRIADIEITLERIECYGTCPAYTVHVRGDGTVSYDGKKYVLLTEHADSEIGPWLLEPVLREMEKIDFLRHEHACRSVITDTAGTEITLRIGGTSRTVADFHGGRECGLDLPSVDPNWHSGIDMIGKLVDAVVRSEQWIGTPEERREAFPRAR